MPDLVPAAPVMGRDYGTDCRCSNCTACLPDPSPCAQWEGMGDDVWCPRCGWAQRFHPEGPTEP